MREIRTSGSEGGEAEPNRPSLPLSPLKGVRSCTLLRPSKPTCRDRSPTAAAVRLTLQSFRKRCRLSPLLSTTARSPLLLSQHPYPQSIPTRRWGLGGLWPFVRLVKITAILLASRVLRRRSTPANSLIRVAPLGVLGSG